jgi:hypothetical protein
MNTTEQLRSAKALIEGTPFSIEECIALGLSGDNKAAEDARLAISSYCTRLLLKAFADAEQSEVQDA